MIHSPFESFVLWQWGWLFPLPALAISFFAFGLLWLLSLAMKDASLVDRFWGLGFLVVVGVYYANNPAKDWRNSLVVALLAIWAVRLSLHIHLRNSGKGEDRRYSDMRQRHPHFALWSLFLYSVSRQPYSSSFHSHFYTCKFLEAHPTRACGTRSVHCSGELAFL